MKKLLDLNFLISLVSFILVLQPVLSIVPQVNQEGLLRPYRSYADVTLFHYYVPKEVSRANFEFAAFMDSPKCPTRDVYVYLQHGSYPVMSADNSTFPSNFWTNRTAMYKLIIKSSYQSQAQNATPMGVDNPLPGSWYAAAYLPDWDKKVQQEGIGHRCQYVLGSIALWDQLASIDIIPIQVEVKLNSEKRMSYYKFYIPSGVWTFTLRINNCKYRNTRRFRALDKNLNKKSEAFVPKDCIYNIFMRPKALPKYSKNALNAKLNESEDSYFEHIEKLPYTDTYYYLLIETETKVSYNVNIQTQECPIQLLGKTFAQFTRVQAITNKNKSKDQALLFHTGESDRDTLNSNYSSSINNECKCVPSFRLIRIKHAQDFSDTFLLEGKEWFTTWLALSDAVKTVASFELLPYVDIGGSLIISLHLDEILMNSTYEEIHVYSCVKKGRPPETLCCDKADISSCCDIGLSLHISSLNKSTFDDSILIPFPEPDNWYISFTTVCIYKGEKVPCVLHENLISLDIRTQPCVLSKLPHSSKAVQPCGPYGVCQEVHKGQFFYTSCRCIGGFRGWACTDNSQAIPTRILVLSTVLLTMSNVFFVPAIGLAAYRQLYTQVLVYLATMVSSTLYHACDQEIYGYCVTRYQVLQFCDFFCSILAFWVTLIALGRTSPKYDSALYMLGAIVIAIGVEYNRTGLMVFVVPFCLGLGIPISVWIYRSVQIKSLIKPSVNAILLFLPGVLLGAGGLILFAFVETEQNYRYTHSAWHAIIALSLLYLLPKRKKYRRNNNLDRNNGSSELNTVNEYQQQPETSTSPVFIITSDMDKLVQDEIR